MCVILLTYACTLKLIRDGPEIFKSISDDISDLLYALYLESVRVCDSPKSEGSDLKLFEIRLLLGAGYWCFLRQASLLLLLTIRVKVPLSHKCLLGVFNML